MFLVTDINIPSDSNISAVSDYIRASGRTGDGAVTSSGGVGSAGVNWVDTGDSMSWCWYTDGYASRPVAIVCSHIGKSVCKIDILVFYEMPMSLYFLLSLHKNTENV